MTRAGINTFSSGKFYKLYENDLQNSILLKLLLRCYYMSIKGIYNSALYIGKQEVNILRKSGRKDTMSYSDMSEIELILSFKNNGIITFKSNLYQDIKFGFLKSSLGGIERAISYINDKAPDIPVVRKTQESFLFEGKIERKRILISVSCAFAFLFILSAATLLYKPKNAKPEYIETSAGIAYTEVPKYSESALQSYSNTLSTGHYIVGIDIPTGTYTFQAKKGFGNVITDDGSLNLIFDATGEVEFATNSIKNIYLGQGVALYILGGQEISCGCSDADINNLVTREQTDNMKDVEIGYGWFTSGTDFIPGTYDIDWIEGNGNIISEFYEDDLSRINEIMGDLDEHYIKSFKHLYLPEGVMLKIDEIKIKLSPSK